MSTNTLDSIRKIHYLKNIETNLHDTLIMNDLADDVSAQFPDGIKFQMPQMAYMQTGNYSGTLTAKNVTTQYSELELNKVPYVTFQYSDVDILKESWDAISNADTNSVYKLKQQMEGDFFAEVTNARYGNGTASAVLTSSTAFSTIDTGVQTLIHAGVNPNNLCVVLDAFTVGLVAQQAISSTFSLSDESFQRGYTKLTVDGAMLYRNQNLSSSTVLDLATNPSNNDTVTINNVTFKFVTTIGTAAGNVLIGADADASAQNLVEAVNAAATGVPGANVGVKYVAVTDDNADFLTGITATDGTNLVTFTSKHGYRPFASSMTNASNDFQAVFTNAVIMERGAIKVAYRNGIQNDKRPVANTLDYLYTNYGLWGVKTSIEGAKRMYKLNIMSQAAEA